VLASAAAPGTVYVLSGLGHRPGLASGEDDFGVHILKSTDFGRSFTSRSANIPVGPVTVIREDPRDPHILYAGTRLGVYVSTNGGVRWDVLGTNLPTVFVSDLQVHARDKIIVAATYGRGMWAFDALQIKAVR
jgi:hypothetical protein